MKINNLKPVIYTTNSFRRGSVQHMEQVILLKALQITTDPKELRKIMGVRAVADVYRTLDKLALRKEYHEALARAGISFDFIVEGIKEIAESGEKDADRLNAFRTLLKSIGLEKYDASDSSSSGTWEEELIKKLDNKDILLEKKEDYEVHVPQIPESAKKIKEEEEKIIGSIYE